MRQPRQPAWVTAQLRADRAAAKKAEQHRADEQERNTILHNFASLNPKYWNEARHTCNRNVGRLLLEHGNVFAHGMMYRARVKSLGCGVYHVMFDEVK